MLDEWFLSDLRTLAAVVASTVLTYATIILYVRISGLRSFAKLSAFEFASTLAVGSILASAATSKSVTVVMAATAVGTLFLFDHLISVGRRRFGLGVVDNEPLLLVRNGAIIGPAMRRTQMTEDDLRGKLREANVLQLSSVRAVIMETTGDVTVLHGDDEVDEDLLSDVVDLRNETTGTVETSFNGFTKLD